MAVAPTTLVFCGSPGAGVGLAAAAAALRLADGGQRTLLIGLSSPDALAELLGVPVGPEPSQVLAGLDALALDPAAELDRAWEEGRRAMPPQMARLTGDELPLLPGMGALFGLRRLRELAPRYQRVVVDAGAHDALLQVLGLPDTLRWAVRLLLGLDRGPGASVASQTRALLPASFLPVEMIDRVQQIRVEAEHLRAELLRASQAVYVLRPDAPALAEAQLALPAIQLHGLPVVALAAGPLLPAQVSAGALLGRQERLLERVAATWPGRPLLRLEAQAAEGLEAVRGLAARLDLFPSAPAEPPLLETFGGEPALAIDLPGLPQGALKLTLSGDDLIVRIGPYRRHVLLPEPLRGISAIRATREGSRLVVRRRG